MATRKLTKRGTRRRVQLLEVAYRLFADQGYHRTTIADVCDALGVGKGVFYWYFESKEVLFIELLQGSLRALRRSQQLAIRGISDPCERIEQGIRASVEFFRADPGFLALIRTAARYEEFSPHVQRGQQVIAADTAIHINEGIEQGLIPPGDPALMAHGILGAILHFVEIYFGTESEASFRRPQLAEEAVTFCMHGILGTSKEHSL